MELVWIIIISFIVAAAAVCICCLACNKECKTSPKPHNDVSFHPIFPNIAENGNTSCIGMVTYPSHLNSQCDDNFSGVGGDSGGGYCWGGGDSGGGYCGGGGNSGGGYCGGGGDSGRGDCGGGDSGGGDCGGGCD